MMTSLNYCYGKAYFHMNIWIVRRECLKHVFLPRRNFIVALLMKTSVMLTTPMPKRFGKHLIWLQCNNTMIDTWNAMLFFYLICSKLSSKYLFAEKGMRGGVSAICNRYAKANNPYLSEGYNPTEESSYITYLDCDNLYGYAMCEPLPTGKFRFLTPRELEDFDLNSKSDDGLKGYILEVDLEYPSNLHETHNDYPLAPEKMVITTDMVSPHGRDLANTLGIKINNKSEKLVPNLMPKNHYVLHYRNLKFYTTLGLKVTKVHKIMEFEQTRWLKPYIEFNTKKRQEAKNAFEKDLFKLMNNSIYRKTLQNNRRHLDVRIVTNEKRAKKLVARQTFQSFNIINEDVTVIKLTKTNVVLDKPIYVGMCILDLSKLHMYDFHYNHILSVYGKRAKLLFTDTDSLTYHIRTDDLYKDMLEHLDVY